jgi:uncharacterized surface protein with fasciclin (FAS1) repeats
MAIPTMATSQAPTATTANASVAPVSPTTLAPTIMVGTTQAPTPIVMAMPTMATTQAPTATTTNASAVPTATQTIPSATPVDSSPAPITGTLAEVVKSTPTLSRLYDAIVMTDMVETLNGPGPFVLFAPTNEAFAKFPYFDEYRYLTNPAWVLHLQEVLKFHMAEKKASLDSTKNDFFYNEMMIPMLNGENAMVTMQGERDGLLEDKMVYSLNPAVTGSATVSGPYMLLSNGELFHVSNVLLPSFFSTSLFELAEASSSMLTTLLVAAGLDGHLESTLGMTVRNRFCRVFFFHV